MKIARALLLLVLGPLAASAPLEAQPAASPSYRLDSSLLSVTGGYSTSSAYGVQGVLTHDPAGSVSSPSYAVAVGFGHAFLPLLLAPTVTKSFSQTNVRAGDTTTLTIALGNPNTVPIGGVSFTDTYPLALRNALVPNVVNTCGGTVTADADGSSVALAGGLIPVGGCSVRVDVRSIVAGPITNTMPPGAVQSENAPPSIETAVAQIQSEMPIPTLSTGFLVLLGLLVAAAGSRLLVRGA